eukprot:Skav213922  [mRNA]  locus=scaffold1439:306795:310370:- [translate_table: standard]
MEGGHRTSHSEYLAAWCSDLARFSVHAEEHIDGSEIPSLMDLERAFRRVQPGKAIGPDNLPPEACRHFAPELARAYYPLLLKVMAHGHEPHQWKGGLLVTAYKHKGVATQAASHRSLLISSHAGKAVHRAIRQHQTDLMQAFLDASQLGGRPHVPVGIGLHEVRAYLRIQAAAHRSAAVVFIDLREAFYRIVRALAVDDTWTDDSVAKVAHAFNLPPSAVHDLYEHLRQPPSASQAGMTAAQRRAIASIHTTTWFTMRSQQDRVLTTRGSRPGDSFADVVFSYVYSRVICNVRSRLTAMNLLDSFDIAATGFCPPYEAPTVTQANPRIGPTWMDDTALLVSSDNALTIANKAAVAASTFIDECRGHALSPNLAKGKTEVLMMVRGTGTKKIKHQYFANPQCQSLPVICESGIEQLSIVGEYLHLGGVVHHGGKTNREAKRRVAIAHQALSQHRRQLYQNKRLPWDRRRELFEMLVLSKLMYGVESWCFPDRRGAESLHASIIRLYRRLLKVRHDQHMSDDQVLFQAGLPSPTDLFRRARLRYLGQLYNAGSATPWGIFNADSQWRALLIADLQWMHFQLANASSLPDPMHSWLAWEELLRFSPSYWKKLVNRAVSHATKQRDRAHRVFAFHRAFVDRVCELDPFTPPNPQSEVSFPDEIHACLQCQRRFSTAAGLGAHMFKAHNVVAHLRCLFDETACSACLREYHTFARLKAHLRHSEQCRLLLRSRGLHCTPAPGIGSATNHHLEASHDGLAPTLQAHGPHLPPVHRLGQDTAENAELANALAECLLDPDAEVPLSTRLQQAVVSCPVTWTQFQDTVLAFGTNFSPEDEEQTGISRRELQSILDQLCHPSTWPFLHELVERSSTADFHDYEEWLSQHVQEEDWSAFATIRPVPRFGRYRYLLHAFAGRRRYGDLQHYLDAACMDNEGVYLITVSVDIIIDRCFGNLANEATQMYWIEAIRRHWVAALVCGPPCNTWSRARGQQLRGADGILRRGPRIVRTLEQAWGAPQLTLRELEDVSTGNCLLQFCVWAFLELALSGGSAILEHPDCLDDDRASIWNLPCIAFLKKIPGVRYHSIAQGCFGAASAKPTGLLSAHLPSLDSKLRAWQLRMTPPQTASIGVDESGAYLTAPLKEYPPALCAAMAQSLHGALSSPQIVPCDGPSQDFSTLCSKLQASKRGSELGADFVRS